MKKTIFIAVSLLVFASLFLSPVAVNAGLPKPPLPPAPPLLPPPPPILVPPPPPVVAPSKDRGRHEGHFKNKKKKQKKHKDRHDRGRGDD
jgi:hypothetical protein